MILAYINCQVLEGFSNSGQESVMTRGLWDSVGQQLRKREAIPGIEVFICKHMVSIWGVVSPILGQPHSSSYYTCVYVYFKNL